MKNAIIVLCLLAAIAFAHPSHAQTVLTAPQVLGCSNPVPPVWPAVGACKAQGFIPLTNTTYTVASGSKTASVWSHTYGGYFTSPTTPLVACPIGATVSADTKSCTANGADASQLVPYSQVATFTIVPAVPKTQSVVISSVDLPGLIVTFSGVPTPGCFTVTGLAAPVCTPAK